MSSPSFRLIVVLPSDARIINANRQVGRPSEARALLRLSAGEANKSIMIKRLNVRLIV